MRTQTLTILGIILSFAVAFNSRFQLPVTKTNRKVSSTSHNVAVPLDIPLDVCEEKESLLDTPKARKQQKKRPLDEKDAWIANLDYDAFKKDVKNLGKELLKESGEADVKHLQKIVSWRDIAALIGLSTVWMQPNPVTVCALSTWIYASWTMIAHHTCHGGYNRVDAGKFKSNYFGLGLLNRCIDWLDWMLPEAWNIEHNRLHHYRLNESKDPDLVERNLSFLRDDKYGLPLKYATVAFFLGIWKWFYYAPNTYKELKINEYVRKKKKLPDSIDPEEAVTIVSLFDPSRKALREIVSPIDVLTKVLGPMFLARYLVIPLLLLAIPGIGPTLASHAFMNLLLAELLTNFHAFLTIVTNHCGEDMYKFDDTVRPKSASFYVRQIIGSVNYDYGNDFVDFSHGWLNYQIEHHVWPDFSMLQYQKGAPKLKAICEKHGVPYIQENVFTRLRKTVDVMVGKSSMRVFPTEYEPAKDKIGDKGVTWKSTHGAIDG